MDLKDEVTFKPNNEVPPNQLFCLSGFSRVTCSRPIFFIERL
ncbi:hypothetical protein VCRA2112O188_320017 [Vibrio crassostreae]|nr:hypothetical protein VCRA2112O187_210017 [Vibrio crassostreae]CAK2012250.1 hypothetical protein VCRA2113O207_340016 [Vibrio crassostreae]CAK2032130.1 hypothetical protein VCRA2116O234_330017 [Vibrio crassostreae]CAK2032678.1 hypothetical protein VCRA2113O194_310017 [Vibrio crassostreae]CAK2035365.1 hypothetical protein VCRA2113O204_310017 [Vibrio crassostreae]